MKSFKEIWISVSVLFFLFQFGCGENPSSSTMTSGRVKVSIRTKSAGTRSSANKLTARSAGPVTLTSARVVIKEIEFESVLEDSFDFEFAQPFVQDLAVDTNQHVIETVQLPFGTYKESEIEIDDLDPEDGQVYTDNPELQDLSIVVEGFLNDNQNETFRFTSDLDVEQEQEFNPPLVLDENSPSTNVVLELNMDGWFIDEKGILLDPRSENNKSEIENNIKQSIDIFEDEDDDGEEDDHGENEDDDDDDDSEDDDSDDNDDDEEDDEDGDDDDEE